MKDTSNTTEGQRRPFGFLGSSPSSNHLAQEDAIVARARAGDQAAMGLLLRHYDPMMRALAWRMLGDRFLMDDVLQDAYLRACRSIRRFRGDAKFATWLHRVVANSCIDALKRRARRREHEVDRPDLQAIEPRHRIDDVQEIERALQSLSFEQRAAVLLVDCEGYSYREVADLFNTSTGTVGSWLSRARQNLRESDCFQ